MPLPILDLINIQTLAEDIADEPAGRDAKKLARQIIDDCAESPDLADVRDMAEQIRATSDAFVREALALQIAEQIEALLTSAETETMKRVKITTRKILSDDPSTKGDRRIDAIDTKTGETVVSAYYKSWDKDSYLWAMEIVEGKVGSEGYKMPFSIRTDPEGDWVEEC